MAFYRVLRAAVARRCHIAFKARLADLVTCGDAAWEQGFGHLIARHHVDFVLCDYRTMEVVSAIELDDRSHAKRSRQRRDQFLDDVLASAGIPLVRIKATARYQKIEIEQAIAVALGTTTVSQSGARAGDGA